MALTYNNRNTASEFLQHDYLSVHVKGNEVFKNHGETGSCFDKTQPLKESKWRLQRPGGEDNSRNFDASYVYGIYYAGHGPPRPVARPAPALETEPRYNAATGEYYYPKPLPTPSEFQKGRHPGIPKFCPDLATHIQISYELVCSASGCAGWCMQLFGKAVLKREARRNP